MSISDKLQAISEVRRDQQEFRRQIDTLSAKESMLRAELEEIMERSDTKTAEGHGIMAIRSTRNTVEVTNREDLENALREAGLYDTCSRLDLDKAKKAGIKHEMPGVRKKRLHVFTIRDMRDETP